MKLIMLRMFLRLLRASHFLLERSARSKAIGKLAGMREYRVIRRPIDRIDEELLVTWYAAGQDSSLVGAYLRDKIYKLEHRIWLFTR